MRKKTPLKRPPNVSTSKAAFVKAESQTAPSHNGALVEAPQPPFGSMTAPDSAKPDFTKTDFAKPDSAKRRQILEGARIIFLRDGFERASMDEITLAAGVSKSTIYAYFDSKVALFESLIREERRLSLSKIATSRPQDFAHPSDFDIHAALTLLARQLVTMILTDEMIASLRMIIAVSPKFPHLGKAFFEEGPLAGNLKLASYFDDLVQAGFLKMEDAALAASQFVHLSRGNLAMQHLLNIAPHAQNEIIETNINAAVKMFLRAYGVSRDA